MTAPWRLRSDRLDVTPAATYGRCDITVLELLKMGVHQCFGRWAASRPVRRSPAEISPGVSPPVCDARSMERLVIDELRRRVAAGEVLTADESQRLFDALDDARRAASPPSEYLVRVARSVDDLDRWTAEHPSMRMSPSATNPADALVLAGAELGRVLGEPTPEWQRRRRVERTVADAVSRTATDPTVADSPMWALAELDDRTRGVHELRTTAAGRGRGRPSRWASSWRLPNRPDIWTATLPSGRSMEKLATFDTTNTGTVVEHWDVLQTSPSESANDNGTF